MAAAPGLVLEAAAGKARGWLSSGICPDAKHGYGYHMPNPLRGDYSLRGPLNVPVGSYCCAYDMQTKVSGARTYVKSLFERIRAGLVEPSTAELIGSWDGVNVWYWAWDKGRTVERYRGSGHDSWCHRSVFRSLATKKLGWLAAYDTAGNLIKTPEGTANMPALTERTRVPDVIQKMFPEDMNIPVGWAPDYNYVLWHDYAQTSQARKAAQDLLKGQVETNRLLGEIARKLPEPPSPS
jgi:hypothetical protein